MSKWFSDSQDVYDKHSKKQRDLARKGQRQVKEESLFSALDELAKQYTEKEEGEGGV